MCSRVAGASNDGQPVSLHSTTTVVVRHLAERPEFVGIGYAKSARLGEAFGDDLAKVLGSGDPGPLVPVLGEDLAASLIEAWMIDLARGDVLVWLAENGFESRLAHKVVRLWGADAAKVLTENPYVMMALTGFHRVDAAARRLGWDRDHPFRLVAAVEGILYDRLDHGDTWISDRDLRGAICKAVGADLLDVALEAARNEGAVLPIEDGWQAAGTSMMEAYVASRIATMQTEPAMGDLIARDVMPEEVEIFLDGWSGAEGVALDVDQRRAVHLAVCERVGLVTGGAGVGKTTVLRAIASACDRFGRTTIMLALAGRAAVRISESTGRPAMTIAAFLKGCAARQIALGPETLVVVDESSMLDLGTFYRILRIIPDEARLLLVGDSGQLPPIGFGLTFHVLADGAGVPTIELKRVYRQTGASGIPSVSRAVRGGLVPVLSSFRSKGPGVTFLEATRECLQDTIVDVAAEIGGIGAELRILCSVKSADWGTDGLNDRLHSIVARGRDLRSGFAIGEPVMFLRNDYRRDLRNGSLGKVAAFGPDSVFCDFDGTSHEFFAWDLVDISLAYAMTVHKAQGSQFPRVIVPIHKSRILDRALIYTAITRASEQVVLVGDPKVFRQAVRAESAATRRLVGLGWRL